MKTAKPPVSTKANVRSPEVEPAVWTLTSGKRLEEFAEQGGYLAPLLLMTNGLMKPGLMKPNVPGLAEWTKKQD